MTFTTERPLSNEDRLILWRLRQWNNRQGSGDCAPSEGGAAFSTEPEPDILLWVTVFASIALTLGVLTAHVIWSAATEPEERCFTNAIGETYCRSQTVWEIE